MKVKQWIELELDCEYYVEPAEPPEYVKGLPVYPGCDATVVFKSASYNGVELKFNDDEIKMLERDMRDRLRQERKYND